MIVINDTFYENKTILEITSVVNDHGYESNYKMHEK